jgi:hypothetical protein
MIEGNARRVAAVPGTAEGTDSEAAFGSGRAGRALTGSEDSRERRSSGWGGASRRSTDFDDNTHRRAGDHQSLASEGVDRTRRARAGVAPGRRMSITGAKDLLCSLIERGHGPAAAAPVRVRRRREWRSSRRWPSGSSEMAMPMRPAVCVRVWTRPSPSTAPPAVDVGAASGFDHRDRESARWRSRPHVSRRLLAECHHGAALERADAFWSTEGIPPHHGLSRGSLDPRPAVGQAGRVRSRADRRLRVS